MTAQALLYRGSVKDLYVADGELLFVYSDRYSVYDWGEMPDAISHKGAALASLTASFFEYLRAQGVPSHYLRQTAADRVAVQPVQVLRPPWSAGRYDYSAYAARPLHTLVPLEVIFRRRLALGNSLQRRLADDPAYLQELGLQSQPGADTVFEPPLIELSTKLESTDRYLRHSELAALGLLSEVELAALQQQTRHIADRLHALLNPLGVALWDGKVEFAWGGGAWPERELLLVDSVGPDELRLTYRDLPLSKEFLRQSYAGTPWLRAVQRAKALARERGVRDWKAICVDELRQQPQPLSAAQLEVAALLYQALANAVAGAVGRALPFDASITLDAWHRKAQAL